MIWITNPCMGSVHDSIGRSFMIGIMSEGGFPAIAIVNNHMNNKDICDLVNDQHIDFGFTITEKDINSFTEENDRFVLQLNNKNTLITFLKDTCFDDNGNEVNWR